MTPLKNSTWSKLFRSPPLQAVPHNHSWFWHAKPHQLLLLIHQPCLVTAKSSLLLPPLFGTQSKATYFAAMEMRICFRIHPLLVQSYFFYICLGFCMCEIFTIHAPHIIIQRLYVVFFYALSGILEWLKPNTIFFVCFCLLQWVGVKSGKPLMA